MTITFDISANGAMEGAARAIEGASGKSRVWLLKRNCALSPRQVLRFYLSLVSISALIAGGFAIAGAWMVLPFAGLEMLALGAALLIYARHSTDHEKVVLGEDGLVVEEVVAGRRSVVSLDPRWVRVVVESGASAAATFGDAVFLLERGRRVAIGRYISGRERRMFASELKRALASPWAA
jgi:uncharacterized membrane protein